MSNRWEDLGCTLLCVGQVKADANLELVSVGFKGTLELDGLPEFKKRKAGSRATVSYTKNKTCQRCSQPTCTGGDQDCPSQDAWHPGDQRQTSLACTRGRLVVWQISRTHLLRRVDDFTTGRALVVGTVVCASYRAQPRIDCHVVSR